MSNRETSPWMWILGGCAFIALLGIIFVVVMGVLGYQFVKDVEELAKSPEKREERTLEMLGAQEIPSGYYAGLVVDIPFLGDVGGLTDTPPKENGEAGEPRERAFFFFNFRFMGDEKRQMEDFFTGKADDMEALEHVRVQGPIDLDFDDAEFIKLGQFEVNRYTAYYRVMRGGVELGRSRGDSLAAMMWIRCPEDTRNRFAAWVVPDPAQAGAGDAPGQEAAGDDSVDYSGTPADENSLTAFMSQFHLCGAH
ncbi:MAG TPA: hypothetical protein VLU25_19315 [Acidobacteriota bacterium]|nr:hypothetical protein [Acidobacteriota bacterium]